MLLNTCQAMGEMAIMYPVSGGFYVLVSRFIDPSWGFAMGWVQLLQVTHNAKRSADPALPVIPDGTTFSSGLPSFRLNLLLLPSP